MTTVFAEVAFGGGCSDPPWRTGPALRPDPRAPIHQGIKVGSAPTGGRRKIVLAEHRRKFVRTAILIVSCCIVAGLLAWFAPPETEWARKAPIASASDCRLLASVLRRHYTDELRSGWATTRRGGPLDCQWSSFNLAAKTVSYETALHGEIFDAGKPAIYLNKPRYSLLGVRTIVDVYAGNSLVGRSRTCEFWGVFRFRPVNWCVTKRHIF